MNDMQSLAGEHAPASAFTFTGTWREFLPIALTNLLLTIVTLGVYRFWAKARERRYLWSRTHFIDDPLEWTGTGKEMFVGFLIVFLILLPLFFGIQILIQRVLVNEDTSAAILLGFGLNILFFYMIGVGSFRALRYRLSRSWWHGIRGGSPTAGWEYGYRYLWKNLVGYAAAGLLIPWSMTSLWNDRWNEMEFGRHRFSASADTDGLFARWLLIYLVPIIGMVVFFFALFSALSSGAAYETEGPGTGMIALVAFIPLLYLAFLLASLSFYAAYYRKVVSSTSVAGIEFEFTARTKDWLKLIVGNIALVIVTLGIGFIFLGYRNWKFAVRHMEASGEINLDELLQSQTAATGDAEGLADAFDIGAI